MKNILKTALLAGLISLPFVSSAQEERDPETNLVIPSKAQWEWHKDEVGVFYHMNPTFPVDSMTFANFDPVKIIDAAESVGAKHIVVVCKHVNGFCWWPTKATKPGDTQNTKNIALTQFKAGKGDVVAEIFKEARKRGIKPGVYLATRDDHYGAGEKGAFKDPVEQKQYNDYYMTQATELATKYGPLAEWWVDGSSNPKLGDRLFALLQEHQPGAVIFQSTHASVRWVGNEHGHAPYPIWNTVNEQIVKNMKTNKRTVTSGDPDGVRWMPAEVDTTFTSGWFGGAPRSLNNLKKVFYSSVGKGVGLLINFPVNRDGTITEATLKRAKEFHEYRDAAVGYPLYSIKNQKGKVVSLKFDKPAEIDHIAVKEDIRFGERIRKFKVEAFDGKEWFPVFEDGISLGYQMISKLKKPTVVSEVRLTVEESVGEPRIHEIYVTRTGMRKPDLTPPTTPAKLAATVNGREVSLKWSASQDPESGIKKYVIYRNNEVLTETTKTTYLDNSADEKMAYEYKVKAFNSSAASSQFSPTKSLKTDADQSAPVLKEAMTVPGRKAVSLKFNETLNEASATDKKNFKITGFKVTSVSLSDDKTQVTLGLNQRIPFNAKAKVLVKSVKDSSQSANALDKVILPVFVNNYDLANHWTMDKASSSKVEDITAKEAKNVKVHGPIKQTSGVKGQALQFDGKTYLTNELAGVQTNFTIATWIKPSDVKEHQVIFAKEQNGQRNYQFRCYISGGKLGFAMSNDAGEGYGIWPFEVKNKLKANEWQHLTIRNKDKSYEIYINGELVASKETEDIIQQPYNFNHFIIGANWARGMKSTLRPFKGALDDFRIYREPLALEEIKLLSEK